MTARVALTYADYAALPDDGQRYELHEGVLSVTPAPNLDHQIVLANLFRILDRHVGSHSKGLVLFAPLDVILTDSNVVQPDLVYLDPGQMRQRSRRGIEGPPTLLVEILSPGTARVDRTVKRALYARHGVPFYWIIDLEARSLDAFAAERGVSRSLVRASGSDPYRIAPFHDLDFAVADLWRSMLPQD
jgi:Uma2 family endonuclease